MQTNKPLPWHRRVGRRTLHSFQPLVAPLLRRLQFRLQQAVEEASVTASIRHVEDRLGIGGPSLAELATIVLNHQRATDARLEFVEQRLNAVLERDSMLLATRNAALERDSMLLATRLDTLRIGLDAVRLDQKATEQATLERLDNTQAALERAGALQSDAAGRSRKDQVELLRMAGQLAVKSDLILQRAAIPLGKDVLARTPEGFLLLPAEDPALVAAMHESGGRPEPGTVAVIQALLRDGDVAVDVGANVGMTVLPAAQQVGPAGHVVAVEPGSRVGGLLRRSLALNGLEGRVTLHLCAAGEVAGSAQLNLDSVSSHSSLLLWPNADRTEEVEVRTVDAMVEPGRRVRLTKLDVEGFEPQVWSGMVRVLAENMEMAVLVEFGPEHLRRAGISIPEWFTMFLSPGFTAYEVDEATGRLWPLRAPAELEVVFSLNLLLLRQPPEAFPELDFA